MNIYNLIKNQININNLNILTSEQKNNTINLINKIDNQGQQMLFILINIYNKEHELEYQGQTINVKEKNSDIKFNLNNLPNLLQHIIYKFSEMHYSKMMDENDRNIIQKV